MNAQEVATARLTQTATSADEMQRSKPIGGFWKRVIDVVLASLLLVCMSPMMIMVALVIWASDGGSIIFGHSRIGFGGRTFKCLKFRTMVPNSAEVLQALLESDPAAGREWVETQKLKSDPRVTRAGEILRKLSIDELPQLINVVRGEMSLVGPRPIVQAEVDRYGSKFRHYEAARPGITGLWQVSGRSDSSYDQRVAYDSQYAEQWSLSKDIAILFKTFFVVVQRKGSY